MMNESSIMRRCKDDWVNATQILKCCNFPKAKRTKILEKGVQQGLHEKVQGGFGRFQGTWIPLEDARKLAKTYGVTEELAPVLFLDFSDPNLIIPRKEKPASKEPAAAKRKYMKKAKQAGDPPRRYKTGKKAALQAAEEAAAAAAAAAAASTGTGPGNTLPITTSASRIISQLSATTPANVAIQGNSQIQTGQIHDVMSSQDTFNSISRQNSYIPPTAQQLPHMYNMSQSTPASSQQPIDNGNTLIGTSNGGFGQPEFQPVSNNNMPAYPNDIQNFQMFQRMQQQQQQQQQQQMPTQQRFFQNGSAPNPIPQQILHQGKVLSSQSSNDSNWSFSNTQKDSDTSINSTAEEPRKMQLQEPSPQADNGYAAQLLRFFSEDNVDIPYFIIYPPADFNINEPIDDEGHTPLHWAASIGNFEMIHLLLSKGANPLVVNNFGLNPLSKLISFNNCFELKNFPTVLDDLELCLINTDINGRTPLHYLCQFAKSKTKNDSLVYYLKVILNKLTILSNQSQVRQINLMKNVLDHQDVHGDTCLHIAVRSGNIDIVKILLQYGAMDDLENINRETARQLITQCNLIPNYTQVDAAQVAYQNQMQLGMGDYLNYNVNNNAMNQNHNESSHNVPIVPGLATPIQSTFTKVETPDTQRTTVQEDDMDDDNESVVARVDKKHLEALTDNKENIFTEKHFDNISTPINKKHNPINSHHPLAVISEVEITTSNSVSETPMPLPEGKNQRKQQQETPLPLPLSLPKQQQDERKVSGDESTPHFYHPHPPKLNDEGKIEDTEDNVEPKLPMSDLSSMISGMINSLSHTYTSDSAKLDLEIFKLKESINLKQQENQESLTRVQKLLINSGIQELQIESIEQGQELIIETIEVCERTIKEKEQELLKVLQHNQSIELAKLVEQHESRYLEEDKKNHYENSHNRDDDLIDQSRIDDAIELSKLQLERNRLVNEIVLHTKSFGIDEKMYKYRKLLSLSCGVKVEEIDSLIDGIAESLTEGMT